MVLYENGEISVSTIEKQDEDKVVGYFLENDFNCDGESGALKPSENQFRNIIQSVIDGDDENNIFVLKKNAEPIGYISMFVEYGKLELGHIAVDKNERGKGYGKLLTELAIDVAEQDGRDVSLYCLYPNSFLRKLGFKSEDNVHYLRKRTGNFSNKMPKIFVGVEEYSKRQELKAQKEVERFKSFLNSDFMKGWLNDKSL